MIKCVLSRSQHSESTAMVVRGSEIQQKRSYNSDVYSKGTWFSSVIIMIVMGLPFSLCLSARIEIIARRSGCMWLGLLYKYNGIRLERRLLSG